MLKIKRLKSVLMGITNTINRFPITSAFLLVTVIYNAFVIHTGNENNYPMRLLTFLLGASISAVLQLLYERAGNGAILRISLMVTSLVVTLIYYLMVNHTSRTMEEVSVRTSAFLFLLLIAFLWIPSIKSKNTFNDSFMASFKAFFTAIFYSGVLFIGIALIIAAIDTLIHPMKSSSYAHAANIIFLLYAPLHFLTLIPVFKDIEIESAEEETQEKTEEKEPYNRAVEAPKFLVSLISYVIIPITGIFTIILLLYILINITGDFWKDNLLEPMLVIYSITVITVYLLSSKLENAFARIFRRIFPKVLIPIVLFQTISSCLKIGEIGVTYGRYYVILFGVFATISGLIFSILPVRKNGLIAPVLIILSFLSILWPVDAFTVSRSNQAGRLKGVLEENGMLSGNEIIPNANLSEESQKTIVSALDYLERLQYADRYDWLISYRNSGSFVKTFGFDKYSTVKYQSIYLYLPQEEMINITGYDFLKEMSIFKEGMSRDVATLVKDGRKYTLRLIIDKEAYLVLQEGSSELIRFALKDIYERFDAMDNNSREMTLEEASFTMSNDLAVLTLIAKSISINSWQDQVDTQTEAYILIQIR